MKAIHVKTRPIASCVGCRQLTLLSSSVLPMFLFQQKIPYNRNEITFSVRKALFGRRGWMVMPIEETVDLKQFQPGVLEEVMSRIRTMELSGITVPEEIKIRLNEC